MRSTISVVIPTYNRYSYLIEALDSVFSQGRPPDEVIVVDDGSSDGTAIKLENAQLPIRLIKQKNAGPAAARNRGIRESTSDWIALLDSDDVWLPEKLAIQEAFLVENPHIDFLFGHMINFGQGLDDTKPEILSEAVYTYCKENSSDLKDLVDCLLISNPIPTPSVIFRKSCIQSVGYLREDLRCAEDYDWWIRWSLLAKCGFIDRVVMKRRIHGENLIADRAKLLTSELIVLEGLKNRTEMREPKRQAELQSAINRERYRLANTYFKSSKFQLAFESLRKVELSQISPTERVKAVAKLIISSIRR
jgi:glycosyltransferase involved in cell wall biosynthesis